MASNQGVGPHFDSGFLTFVRSKLYLLPGHDGSRLTLKSRTQLLQVSSHNGLQVQNLSGDWIDVPPISGTFVVNIGKGKRDCFILVRVLFPSVLWQISTAGLEMVTHGLARATSHRVLSPPPGSTPRYSIPFFQNIGQNLRLGEIRLDCEYSFGCGNLVI